MTTYIIPLNSPPQTLAVTLNGNQYNLRVIYSASPNDEGGWIMDISDANQNLLLAGVPFVTGADLLAQYGYLGIGGKMFVTTDGDLSAPPSFTDLGTTANLYYEL